MRVLLEKGARTEAVFLGGYTPLYIASQNGHLEVVELLCKYGANLDKIGMRHIDIFLIFTAPNGSTAIYVSSQNGLYKVKFF